MTGFTAINAPTTDQSQLPDMAQTLDTRSPTRKANVAQQRPKTVVSGYLGRGDSEEATHAGIPNGEPLRGPGTKTTGGKGKKRASASTNQENSKRRKVSEVSDGMTIMKSNVQTRDKAKTKSNAPNPANLREEATTSQSVNVFAQPTSMDAVHTSSHQTSVDALRASNGHEATLYKSDAGSSYRQGGVKFSQPWLNQPANIDRTGAIANTRTLRPRKAATRQPQQLSAVAEENDTDLSYDTSSQQTSVEKEKPTAASKQATCSNANKSKKPPARQLSSEQSRASDEDFIGDDDDVAETLALAEDIESKAKAPHETSASSSSKTHFPTPANSDAPASQHGNENPRRRNSTPILNLDEEFIELSDGDEPEIIDLTMTVERTAVQRSPTPPPRERKLNMREVHAHEDYGGALLSEAERQLLGRFYR